MSFSLVVKFGTVTNPATKRAALSSVGYAGFMIINMLLAAIAISSAPDSQGVRTLITFLFTMLWPIVLGIHLIMQVEPKRLAATAFTPQDIAADDASSWYPAIACVICLLIYLPASSLLGMQGAGFVLGNALYAALERRLIP